MIKFDQELVGALAKLDDLTAALREVEQDDMGAVLIATIFEHKKKPSVLAASLNSSLEALLIKIREKDKEARDAE